MVKWNSVMDPNLGIHRFLSACPPTNKKPLILEEGAFEVSVKQGLSLFTYALILYFLHLVFKMFLEICFLDDPHTTVDGRCHRGLAEEEPTIGYQL